MFARLFLGLVLGLIMLMPRQRPRFTAPWLGVPPIAPPHVSGEWPPSSTRRDTPPTPPPGYDGEWPRAEESSDVPPTPPPGFEGTWPGERPSLHQRFVDLLRELFRDRVADARRGPVYLNAASRTPDAPPRP